MSNIVKTTHATTGDELLKQAIKDTGGPAYPWGEHGVRLGGMTLRDVFAKDASDKEVAEIYQLLLINNMFSVESHQARLCAARYFLADAMLAERTKP